MDSDQIVRGADMSNSPHETHYYNKVSANRSRTCVPAGRKPGSTLIALLTLPGLLNAPAIVAQTASETIEAAADALGMVRTVQRRMDSINAVQFAGTGTLRTPETARRWTEHEIVSATIGMSYYLPAMRMDMTLRASDGNETRTVEVVRGDRAWNEVAPGIDPTDRPGQAPARLPYIWLTPHGVVRAAVDAEAVHPGAVTIGSERGRTTLAVTVNEIPFTTVLDANNRPERVTATIDHPVLGRTELVAAYSDYKDWQLLDVYFPSRIVHTLDGETALDLTVTQFFQNPYVIFPTPEQLERGSQ
jgi:hypothetical protein